MKFPDDYFVIKTVEEIDLRSHVMRFRSRLTVKACNFPCGGRVEQLEYSTEMVAGHDDWEVSGGGMKEVWREQAARLAIREFMPHLQAHLKKIEMLLYPPRLTAGGVSGLGLMDTSSQPDLFG